MFQRKEVRIFLKGQAKESYLRLKDMTDKESLSLVKSIERIKGILKENPQHGNPIKKDLIPKNFKNNGITNLYRVELSNFWRMLYTINGNRIEIFLFVLNIINHKDYNKIFGYKRK